MHRPNEEDNAKVAIFREFDSYTIAMGSVFDVVGGLALVGSLGKAHNRTDEGPTKIHQNVTTPSKNRHRGANVRDHPGRNYQRYSIFQRMFV